MAKDRKSRAWSINRAQCQTYPERPKPVPNKGSYKPNRYDNFLGISQREVKATDELTVSRDRLYFYNRNNFTKYKGHKHVMKPAKRVHMPKG